MNWGEKENDALHLSGDNTKGVSDFAEFNFGLIKGVFRFVRQMMSRPRLRNQIQRIIRRKGKGMSLRTMAGPASMTARASTIMIPTETESEALHPKRSI
jgi:hypothetical protein